MMMGKIVKYCVSCDEGFAEKFGFCPTCGSQLQSFEMNPVTGEAPAGINEPPAVEEAISAEPPVAAQFEPEAAPASYAETAPPEPEFLAETAGSEIADETPEIEEPQAEDVMEVQASEAPVAAPAETSYPAYAAFASPDKRYYAKDDGYYVTVIQEKNVKQRNVLLMGATALMLILAVGGTVYSLFHKELELGAITDGDLYAFVPVVDEVPMDVDQQKKQNKDKGGGGGGGGREEQTETSHGRLANQTEKPLMSPDARAIQANTELKNQTATQGKNTYPPSSDPYGNPNSRNYDLSNGPGSGGGQGSGSGTGQGSGRGSGNGSGNGSGSGSGEGSGNGSGRGGGDNGDRENPPPPPTGISQDVKIISKPRANYTDAARQNNIQGNVTLRITFLASGQIGGISPVSGLPYGLTEQAIAAARSIRFEPAMRNGVAVSKQKTIQYGFTIY